MPNQEQNKVDAAADESADEARREQAAQAGGATFDAAGAKAGLDALQAAGKVQTGPACDSPEEAVAAMQAMRAKALREQKLRIEIKLAEFAEQGDPICKYFAFMHLPERLQDASATFAGVAVYIMTKLPRCPERTVALRKLLEGKDAAVRAALG